MGKARLDNEMFLRGLATSREKAKALIMAGEVKVNGVKVDKPSINIDENDEIQVATAPRYVSRGGYKLEQAIIDFNLDFKGKIVMDVGASTGGYTDCALQNGASQVIAIDVGYGQLDWKLRNDERVINIERTNIRYFTLEAEAEKVDIITIDVSFISTAKVFPVVAGFIKDDGVIISLIKPQFEAGKDQVGKKGVVKSAAIHQEVILAAIENARNVGLNCVGVTYSPITGPKGNIEYFLCLRKDALPLEALLELVAETVFNAHKNLGG